MLPDNMSVTTTHEGRNYHRFLYKDGVEVSALAVIDYTTRLGGCEVHTGGIGNVRTPEEHRKKGYMRILMEDTLEYMKEEGYDISLLLGIPDFYHKYGYAVSLPKKKYVLDYEFIHEVEVDRSAYTFRDIEIEDYENILAIYNRNNHDRSASVVRTREFFWGFARGSELFTKVKHFLIEDSEGEILAYVVYDDNDDDLHIVEIESVDNTLYYLIMDEIKRLDNEFNRDFHDIFFYMPYDHPFMQFLRRYGIDLHVEFPRNGMGMSRIMNQLSTLQKIVPDIERRIEKNLGARYSGELEIKTDLDSTLITVVDGKVSVSEGECDTKFILPQQNLAQLLHAYRTVDDICIDATGEIRCDNRELAQQLMPEKFPYLWCTDLF